LKWEREFAKKPSIYNDILAKMKFPHVLSDTISSTYYGYAVFVRKNHLGNYLGHTGHWPGYENSLVRYTDHDRTIIVLSNNESPSDFIQEGISTFLFDQPITVAYHHKFAKQDNQSLDLFTGSFSFNGWNFDIILERDTLFQVFGPGYRRVYLPESNSKILPADGQDIQFELEKNDRGEVKHYVIVYGVKKEMKNLKK
jgi:hypothetical protein